MLREPCEHGKYDGHWLDIVRSTEVCPGGRTLTDAEALTLLLTDECGTCHGTGIDGATYRMATHLQPSEAEPCPSCGGSGRTLRDGVAERINHNGEPTLVVPMSILKGGN